MNFRHTLTITQLAACAAFAAGPPMADFCDPFNGKDCEITWMAPTNLPVSLKIYAVVPTKFSPATVSNLLQIAGLKPKDKKRPTQDGVFGGKDVLVFANQDDSRHLDIVPSQGVIGLGIRGTEAQIPRESPVGVPDPQTALRLTLDMLGKIGINKSELATNAEGKLIGGFPTASVTHKDKRSGKLVSEIVQRGVELPRQIDGFLVQGTAGGVLAQFGNEGRLGYLSVVWRAIKPEKDCRVPTAAEFGNKIKAGQTWINSDQANIHVKKIVITKVSLFYWEKSGSEPQSHIYPYAVLEAKTDQLGENSTIHLFAPFAN